MATYSPEVLSRLHDERLERYSEGRYIFERDWYRNVLYFAGNQYITYSRSRRMWMPRQLPDWFPRRVTNRFAEKINDIVATLTMRKPEFSFTPTSSDTKSVAMANVGSRIERVLWKEAGLAAKLQELAGWMVTTGNAFLLVGYEEGEHLGMMTLPAFECPVCGLKDAFREPPPQCPNPDCPSHQAPELFPGFVPSTVEVPRGRVTADVLSPFEVFLDSSIPSLDRARGFMRVRSYPRDVAEAFARSVFGSSVRLPEEADSDLADSPQTPHSQSRLYLESLAYTTARFGATPTPGIEGTGGGFRGPKRRSVIVSELWELASSDYPEGVYSIRIGGSVALTKGMPLPSRRRDGTLFLPLVHFGGDVVPGRFWRKTRADDLIPKQDQRNLVEAAIELITRRMSNPLWLIPRGTNPTPITGNAGLKVYYNAVSAGGTTPLAPQRIPGENVPNTLVLWLNKIDDDMERVAGTFFLQGGDTPPGVTAASALAFLSEKAQRAMSPWLRSWEDGLAKWVEYAIETARTRAPEPRLYVASQNNRFETQRFILTDLEGEVEVQVEAGSSFPQSQAAVRATVESLIRLGLINPADPATAYNILQNVGLAHLSGVVDEDFKIAASEFDKFRETGQMPPPDPVFDNHFAHYTQHMRDAKTDAYRDMPLPLKAQFTQHALAHVQYMMQWGSLGLTPPPQSPTAQAAPASSPQPPGRTIPAIRSPETGDVTEPTKEV